MKADLREFVVRRLFEVVLNRGYLTLLNQLLHQEIKMTGGSPEVTNSFVVVVCLVYFSSQKTEYNGEEQVFTYFKQLYQAFDDFEVIILRVSFDSEGDAVCRWRITGGSFFFLFSFCLLFVSGVHNKPLWDHPPSEKRVAMYGISQIYFEKDQFRLVKILNAYRLPLLPQTTLVK